MEFYDIPYVGSDSYALSLSLNKLHTKLIAKYYEIATPKFEMIENIEDVQKITSLEYPIVIKPNSEGSSMIVIVIHKQEELTEAIKTISKKYGFPLICEEYIYGNEVSVPIIGTGKNAKPLGTVEFKQNNGDLFEIYSTEAKYYFGCQTLFFEGSAHAKKVMMESAVKIYNALGCRDFGRVDYRVRGSDVFFLEINPLPTICEHGSFELCANASGYSLGELLENIINSANSRYCGK